MIDPTDDESAELTTLDEGMTLDYITGDPVKETPKELVRQRIARALLHEYGDLRGGHGAGFPPEGGRQEQEGRHRHL
jgi:hypothetical protein